jgi:hypothetical protein
VDGILVKIFVMLAHVSRVSSIPLKEHVIVAKKLFDQPCHVINLRPAVEAHVDCLFT